MVKWFKNYRFILLRWLKNWSEGRKRRSYLDSFEESLYEVLRYIHIRRKQINGKEGVLLTELRKTLSFSEEELDKILDYAEKNKFVDCYLYNIYSLTPQKGLRYILDYRKIKAQEKSTKAMGWATIAIAVSAILTLYLTFISTSPQVAVTDNYFCPTSFRSYEGYSTIVNIPVRNIGKMQSLVDVEILGVNVYGESIRDNYLIPALEDSDFSYRVIINNSNLDYAEYYFKINYKRPFNSIGVFATKTCKYKRDETGGFIRQEN